MAVNIFDKFGIKEVANVYFEALDDDPSAGVYKGDIVLFLDTLKVSTIETTAENTAAQGGWGNPKLIQWDYNKEINVTLEDALLSWESLRFMLGGAIKRPHKGDTVIVRHSEEVVCGVNGRVPKPVDHLDSTHIYDITPSTDHPVKVINLTTGARTQLTDNTMSINGSNAIIFKNPHMLGTTEGDDGATQTKQGDRLRIFWETVVTTDDTTKGAENAVEVTISPNTFPGTYKIIGDTFMRSQDTGKDEAFQFIIGKAKVASEVTITLEAEGDPATFEMTLNVLRDTNERGENEMMKLVRYTFAQGTSETGGNDIGSLSATTGSN